ncbi:alpha/beta fold hydrolase [Nocardia goodfellowii]|uniref:Pimeloyl-ACP methyl ester carboxylesterase n=1 Tax=Nocardia goodfellowii TaxID=882446 RepID=A0ABS4QR87_9NOCA|nr:alpha/beta hydrolase [Nocardia goodfellowii]MBP2194223.1 pimeloyl-ACP methyl ester carboxylesterase [Nocardia goodfellowii]
MTNNLTIAPPIGGFQEIDGRRVFVHRSGRGGPAVVFLPGASAVGLDYFGVQQQVSQFTTAVVYDRGGSGYSDPLPVPRTAAAVAGQLRELLRALGIPGPYVLAAHSLGGLFAHRFAQLYPQDVAGLVWLDAVHHDWDAFMPAEASLAAAERQAPDLAELRRMRPELRRMHAELLAGYPEPMRQPLLEAKVSDAWLRAGIAERGALVDLATELRAGPGLPDVPLVALTVAADLREPKARLDAAVVHGVVRGEQRLVSDTYHHRLCFDRPDAVVQAIRDVIDQAGRP